MKKHVLIVGGVRPIHKKIRELGHDTSLIVSSRNADSQDFSAGYRYIIVVPEGVSNKAWVDIAVAIHTSQPVTHIASFHDDDQDKAIAIGAALGLKFWLANETLEWTRDKFKMRERLRSRGLDTIFSQVAYDDHELETCFKGADFPLIVKPISGAASRGVIAIKNSEQAREMFTDAHRDSIEYPVVVETFIVGEEFSVEGFSNEGKHRFWGITRKKKFADSFVESGHEFPARLEKELADRILEYVGSCLTALGILHGATHTEIIVSKDGQIHIVETHTRLGGDRIVDLVRLVTGEDPFMVSAKHAIFEIEQDYWQEAVRHHGAAVVRFLAAQENDLGILGSVQGMENARDIPLVTEISLLKAVGDQLTPLTSSFDRLALAVAHGTTYQEAEGACLSALSELVFQHQKSLAITGR